MPVPRNAIIVLHPIAFTACLYNFTNVNVQAGMLVSCLLWGKSSKYASVKICLCVTENLLYMSFINTKDFYIKLGNFKII